MDFLLMTEGGIHVAGREQPIPVAQRYNEVIAEAKAAEEAGFDVFGCGEQHFDPPHWTISNPETMLAAVARETKRIKIRSTIFLLPLSHPLRVAEAIGTLDILSDGRLELGVGKGNSSRALKGFQIPIQETEERFLECLTIIKGALGNETFSYEGKYYSFEDVQVLPKSLQRPHPPIYYGAISPKSHEFAGQHGFALMTLTAAMSADQVRKRFKLYLDTFVDAPGALKKISVGVQSYCGPDLQRARDEARDSILDYLARTVFLYEATLREKGLKFDFSNTKQIIKDYDYLIDNKLIAVGDPKALIDTYQYYRDLGANEIRIRCDGLPHDMLMKNIRMIGEKVIPHFK